MSSNDSILKTVIKQVKESQYKPSRVLCEKNGEIVVIKKIVKS